MPKMRGIKPETWTDDKIVELSPLARLLFIGMWNYACDNGHVENKPKQLKLRILPADDCDVAALVKETVDVGCVVDHGDHLSIPTLPQHQRIDRRYFTSCDHCDPDEIPASPNGHTPGTRRAHSVDTAGSRVEGRKEGEMKEGEGERKGDSASAAPTPKRRTKLPPDFRPTEEHIALATELGVDLRAEWPKFVDHWRGNGETKADWPAVLRNWIRRAQGYGGNVRPLQRPASPDEQPVIPFALDDRR